MDKLSIAFVGSQSSMTVSGNQLADILKKLKAILDKVQDPLRDDWDPLEFGLLLSQLEYEDLDLPNNRAIFDSCLNLVKKNFPEDGSLKVQVEHLISVFGKELEFHGDTSNYYNIKNAFLNDVLLRRKGIPISLSLVFMALARGVGLKAVGIAFPGHFLVKVVATEGHFTRRAAQESPEDWREASFIDCFDRGTQLTVPDCEKRLYEWTRGAVPFGPDCLRVAHPVDILSRMLRNLKAIFLEKEDLARLYWVLSALIELSPGDRVEALRERGILFARMGRFPQANQDLREFLLESRDPEKRARVELLMRSFEGRGDLTN